MPRGRSDDRPAARLRRKGLARSVSPGPAAGIWQERVFLRLASNIEIFAVRFGKPLGFQSFPGTTLVVIDGRQVAVGGLLVDEQCERLAPALDATVELGIGLRKHAGVQIGA